MKNNTSRFIKILCAVFTTCMVSSCTSNTTVITSPTGIQIPGDLSLMENQTETVETEEVAGEKTIEFISGTYFSGGQRPEVVSDSKQYLDEAPVDAPVEGKIVYSINNENAGEIVGNTVQEAGGSTTEVRAVAKLGYKFVKWSDGYTKTKRSGDSAEGLYTAIFDYDILGMPIVTINTKNGRAITSKENYTDATYSILGCSEEYEITSETLEIRGRGNNSWGYPKKSYKLKLTKKDNLLGIADGKERVWCLLANQCDQSLQRNHIAFELGRYFNAIAWEPASTSVEVYMNGEYAGVYLLVEDIQILKNRVDVDDKHRNEVDTGYLLELSNYASGEVIYAANRSYMIHNDLSTDRDIKREQKAFIQNYINECYKALEKGDKKKCEELIDLDSLVATYLVEEITKNLDSQWDSFNVHKDAGGKLVFGPIWDFDLSLGNADEGAEKYTDIYVGNGQGSGGGFNTWFAVATMHDWFREMVQEKWLEVYDSISLMPKFIVDEAELGLDSYRRNFDKWKILGTRQNRETDNITRLRTYTAHYTYLAEWMTNRIEWLNDAFTSDSFVKDGSGIYMAQLIKMSNSSYGNDSTKEIHDDYESLNDFIYKDSINGPDGFGNEGAENLFDDQRDTKYCINNDNKDITVTFRLMKAQTVDAYLFRTANDTAENPGRNPDSWTIYGSNDNKEWTVISEISDGKDQMGEYNFMWYGFEIENPAEYKFYKIVFKNKDGIMQLSDIRLMSK